MAEAGVVKGARAGSRSRSERQNRAWRIFRWAASVILVLVVLPYLIVPLYAFVNPPITLVMLQKAIFDGAGIHRTWVDFDRISPNLIRAVLAGEDARFCSHHGIDWVEVQNALDDDVGTMRGASTITMQTVRNLFFPNMRSWIRKGLEAPLALYADFILGKRRILEIYLNVAEFGTGIYGAQEAAKQHFGIAASALSANQAALLAATLPAPQARDPEAPSRGMRRSERRIAGRAAMLGPYDDCVLK